MQVFKVNILSLTKRLYHVATQITFLVKCVYESVCWYHTLGFSTVITFIYSTFCVQAVHTASGYTMQYLVPVYLVITVIQEYGALPIQCYIPEVLTWHISKFIGNGQIRLCLIVRQHFLFWSHLFCGLRPLSCVNVKKMMKLCFRTMMGPYSQGRSTIKAYKVWPDGQRYSQSLGVRLGTNSVPKT